MPGTSNGSGQWITVGEERFELIYSMLSLEKIEEQFGSVTQMQALITDESGEVKMDRPVIKLIVDILHAGLLHVLDDTPEARRMLAAGMKPAQLDEAIEAFTVAFTDAFGELGEKVMAEGGESITPRLSPAVLNREMRRAASHGNNGTTSPPSSSKGRKASGKK